MCSFLHTALSCHVVLEQKYSVSKILSQSSIFGLGFGLGLGCENVIFKTTVENTSGCFYHKLTVLPLLLFLWLLLLISTAVSDGGKWHHKLQYDITNERVFQLSCYLTLQVERYYPSFWWEDWAAVLPSAGDTTHAQNRQQKEHIKGQPRGTASLVRGCHLLHDCTIGIAADRRVRVYVVWCCCAMVNFCTRSFWPQGSAPQGGLPLPTGSSSDSCFSCHTQTASSAPEHGTSQLVGRKMIFAQLAAGTTVC